MKRQVVIRNDAEADIEQAWSRYESIVPGIADAFLAELVETLDHLESFPEMYQPFHRTARRAVLGGFPYSIFYRVLPVTIEVIAVFHSHSDPKHAKRRVNASLKLQ